MCFQFSRHLDLLSTAELPERIDVPSLRPEPWRQPCATGCTAATQPAGADQAAAVCVICIRRTRSVEVTPWRFRKVHFGICDVVATCHRSACLVDWGCRAGSHSATAPGYRPRHPAS